MELFAKKHYMLTGGWILGLILVQFATGFTPSDEALQEYGSLMETIDDQRMMTAQQNVWEADNAYYSSKGWFSCNALCTRNYKRLQRAQAILDQIKAEDAAVVSQAKSKLGLFSDAGVQETRDLFWGTFAREKLLRSDHHGTI